MDVNGVAMAPDGLKLSQDGATDHMNLLETYLALYKPPGIKKLGFRGSGFRVKEHIPYKFLIVRVALGNFRWRGGLTPAAAALWLHAVATARAPAQGVCTPPDKGHF